MIKTPKTVRTFLCEHQCVSQWVAGLFALLLATQIAPAAGNGISPFTAEGTVLTEVFQKPGLPNPSTRIEKNFFFSYNGNGRWQMELKNKKGGSQTDTILPKDISAEQMEQMADSVVDCRNIPDGIRYVATSRKGAAMAAVTNIWRMANLESTAFPPPEMTDLFISWLTLCPNPRLPIIEGNKMRRLISAEFLKDPKNPAGEYALKYAGPDNAFVSELRITNNGMVPMSDGTLLKLSPPFDKGHLEFEYKVLETTNWNGVVFPLRSVLYKHTALPGGRTQKDLFSSVVARLNVESIRAGVDLPEIDLRKASFMVYDNRLPHLPGLPPIKYVTTNDLWVPATNQALVKFAAAYNMIMRDSSPSAANITAKKRHIMAAVMLVLALGPLLGLICYKTMRRNNNKNKTV